MRSRDDMLEGDAMDWGRVYLGAASLPAAAPGLLHMSCIDAT